MENLAVLFCCEAPEMFYGLTNCTWFSIRWTFFNKLWCQLVNLHPQHTENINNINVTWVELRVTYSGRGQSFVGRSSECWAHWAKHGASMRRAGSRLGDETWLRVRGLSSRGRAEKSSSATEAPVQRRNMVHASRCCLTEVMSRSWVSVIFFSPLKGAHVCLTSACRVQLVVSIYVGVSLQRWANESLVSSMKGRAEAMLLSYWWGRLEEIISTVPVSRKDMHSIIKEAHDAKGLQC